MKNLTKPSIRSHVYKAGPPLSKHKAMNLKTTLVWLMNCNFVVNEEIDIESSIASFFVFLRVACLLSLSGGLTGLL